MARPSADSPGAPAADLHRHQWSVIDFFVADERPMMRQRCACGARRDVPAWDRAWEPPNPDGGA